MIIMILKMKMHGLAGGIGDDPRHGGGSAERPGSSWYALSCGSLLQDPSLLGFYQEPLLVAWCAEHVHTMQNPCSQEMTANLHVAAWAARASLKVGLRRRRLSSTSPCTCIILAFSLATCYGSPQWQHPKIVRCAVGEHQMPNKKSMLPCVHAPSGFHSLTCQLSLINGLSDGGTVSVQGVTSGPRLHIKMQSCHVLRC